MTDFEQIFEETRDVEAVSMLHLLVETMRRADFADSYIIATLLTGVRKLMAETPDKAAWASYFAAVANELYEAN
jgi:hypothetical protein